MSTDTYRDLDVIAMNEEGTRRVRLEREAYASEPEFDYGSPVLRVSLRSLDSHRVWDTLYGAASRDGAGLTLDADSILEHFISAFGLGRGIEIFDRYLRIFHNGRAIRRDSYPSDHTYVAYTTERMVREVWGVLAETITESMLTPDMDEYLAWVEGDVWVAIAEEKVRVTERRERPDGSVHVLEREDWEIADAVGGFYGREAAEEGANELL